MNENFSKIHQIKGVAQFGLMAIENIISKDESSIILTTKENCIKIVDTNQLYSIYDLYFKALHVSAIDYEQKTSQLLAGFANG